MVKLPIKYIINLNIIFTSFSKKGFVEICSGLLFSIFIKSLNVSFKDGLEVDSSPSSTNENSCENFPAPLFLHSNQQ